MYVCNNGFRYLVVLYMITFIALILPMSGVWGDDVYLKPHISDMAIR